MGLAEWYDRVSAHLYSHAHRRKNETWAWLILGTFILVFETYQILANGVVILPTRRHSSSCVRGDAAWICYYGIVSVCLGFYCFSLGLQANDQDRLAYRRVRRWALRIGVICIATGAILEVYWNS